MKCRVQIQRLRHVLNHADRTAPTRKHELDRTGIAEHLDQLVVVLF